eukprot:TRINITY_DN8212_c0_g1_i2.p1 TRINITY_DN8212_c0_g1~~TRINITY_DN8212_c0_g1_i2.p1  ORF type:complete len:108 (-),score=1.74 TRINITY_DN8212_c0_g1_i2:169-492(-)
MHIQIQASHSIGPHLLMEKMASTKGHLDTRKWVDKTVHSTNLNFRQFFLQHFSPHPNRTRKIIEYNFKKYKSNSTRYPLTRLDEFPSFIQVSQFKQHSQLNSNCDTI